MKEERIIESWRTSIVLGAIGIFSLIFLASLIGLLWFPLFLIINSTGLVASGLYIFENRSKWKKSYCILTPTYIEFYYSKMLYKKICWSKVNEIEILPDFWVAARHGSIRYGYLLLFKTNLSKDQIKLYCFPYRKKNQLLIIKKIVEITKALKIKANLEDTLAVYRLDSRTASYLTTKKNSKLVNLSWKCKELYKFRLKKDQII